MLRLDLLFFMLGAVLASPEMAETIGLESGGWYLSRGEDREARLSLSSDDAEGKRRSNWTTDLQWTELEGLEPSALDRADAPIIFRLRRDAGTFVCQGRALAHGRAAGDWRLELNPDYGPALVRRGYGRPNPSQQVEMAWANVALAFVDELTRQGYPKSTIDGLIRAAHHGVNVTYTREMGELGLKRERLEDLVQMRDHGVSPRYVRALAAHGSRASMPRLSFACAITA